MTSHKFCNILVNYLIYFKTSRGYHASPSEASLLKVVWPHTDTSSCPSEGCLTPHWYNFLSFWAKSYLTEVSTSTWLLKRLQAQEMSHGWEKPPFSHLFDTLLPSLNLLYHSKNDARFMQDDRKAVWSIPYVSVAAFFPSLKQFYYISFF